MKIVKPKNYSTNDIHKQFKKDNPTLNYPYWLFKEIIARCNKKISDRIINGDILKIGFDLGEIRIKKIPRNYGKLTVNWGESKKQRTKLINEGKVPKNKDHPDGEEWLICFTDPWYLRWGWVRKGGKCKVKNQKAYAFTPTSDKSKKAGEVDLNKLGNKGKLVLANRLNPALHLRYENYEED